jgi:hypothetical protein
MFRKMRSKTGSFGILHIILFDRAKSYAPSKNLCITRWIFSSLNGRNYDHI